LRAIPHAQESFLHQVLGDTGIPHDAQNQRVCQPAVAIVQLCHGFGIALFQARHQLGITLTDQTGEK
jgi:hypothetical protein